MESIPTKKRRNKRLGSPRNCGRRRAQAKGRGNAESPYLQEDHKRACNRAACPACGPYLFIEKTTTRTRLKRKAAEIGDQAKHIILGFQPLPIHSESAPVIEDYFTRVREVKEYLKDAVGVTLFAIATHITPFKSVKGEVVIANFHAHLILIANPHVEGIVKWLWSTGDDQRIKYKEPDSLSHLLNYILHDPLKGFEDDQRLRLNNVVLGQVEERLGRTALDFGYGGSVLSGSGNKRERRASEVRRRFIEADSIKERIRLAKRHGNALKSASSVHLNGLEPECPDCYMWGKGIKRNGPDKKQRQTYRCKRCGRTFTIENTVLAESTAPCGRLSDREGRKLWKLYREFGSFAAVARKTGRHRNTVRKYVQYYEASTCGRRPHKGWS